MCEVEIISDGKHVGWLTGHDVAEIDTVSVVLEEAGYEVDWGDEDE